VGLLQLGGTQGYLFLRETELLQKLSPFAATVFLLACGTCRRIMLHNVPYSN
jgi:hypothetical protein